MLKTVSVWLFIFGYAFSLASASSSTFTITEPYNLYKWWNSNSDLHHYSVAYFGEIPWGEQIMGQIGLAHPIDACSKIQVSNKAGSVPPILVAVRGQCTFVTKAKNAEEAGAKLLLIVDNVDESVEGRLMVDTSGNTTPIRIASVMIDKQSGDKLIEEVEQDERQNTVVSGAFDFAVTKEEPVSYHLWLSNGAKGSFEFLKDFKQYRDKLFLLGEMQVHFLFDQKQSSPDCVCGTRYCSPWTQGDLFKSGREVVLESLKQFCIIKQFDLDTWWKYVMEFANSCLDSQNTAECSKSISQKLKLDSTDLEYCVTSSFDDQNNDVCTYNSIFDEEMLAQNTDQAFITPSIKINDFYYRGNTLPSKGVFSAICHSFHRMPDACRTTLQLPSSPSSGPGGFPSNITIPFPLTNTSLPGGFPTNITLPFPSTNTSQPPIIQFPGGLQPGTLPTLPIPPERNPSGAESERDSNASKDNTITLSINKTSLIIVLAVVFCVVFALFVLFLYRRSVKRLEANMQANSQNRGTNLQYVQYGVVANNSPNRQPNLQYVPYAVLGNNLPSEEQGNNSSYRV